MIRPRLIFIAFAAALAVAPAAGAAAPPERLVVLLERERSDAATAVAARAGVRPDGPRAPQIGLVTVTPRPGETMAQAARRLRADPAVASVEPEGRMRLRYVPNDPALSAPELSPRTPGGTTQEWWASPMGLPAAWDVTRGGGALVAVIDTGADGSHPELAGKIRDAVDLDETFGAGPATTDEHGHGTHVASLACARADNRIAIAGAGLNCGLLIIKSDLSDSSVATGIVEAVDRGADAINMSFGSEAGRGSAALRRAIDYAVGKKVVLVAAASDGVLVNGDLRPVAEQGYPSNVLQPTGTGASLNVGRGLSVTAATAAGTRASYAGYGSQISLAAYGAFGADGGPAGLLGAFPLEKTELESGDHPCKCRTKINGDARYAYLEGTSMAAPLVTAVAALVRDLNPDLSLQESLRVMKQTARRPGAGWAPDLGWGILDAGAALQAAKAMDRTKPVSRLRITRRSSGGRRLTVTVTGSDRGPKGVVSSGVARYDIFRSLPGRAARKVATTTTGAAVQVSAPAGGASFFSVAVDRAGNREVKPAKADARVG
ncbi:S8 family serine peptidase [Svornostia abyssi]|uniref:S8 family serine peptidase n=1 Tax=Svornostia abyssi TaxID=2898438 RepID=A0ABY5PEW3_9ACTN|nr:S8 family serine peptidase [Parviterribacteraceae bacterium J379]